MSDIDLGTQPHCPECDVVMRDDPRGYKCPACEHVEDLTAEYAEIESPPDFDGPSVVGG